MTVSDFSNRSLEVNLTQVVIMMIMMMIIMTMTMMMMMITH